MPFASGIFTRLYSFVADAAAGIPAQPQRFDNELNGIATALTDCVTRDGQSAPYTNLPMGGHNFANLGPATVAGQAMTYDQLNAIAGAAILGASDNAAGIKWTTIQAFINYLLSMAGAGAIGTTDGSNVQADLTNFVANAVAAIAPYSTSAQNSAAIATSAVLGLPYFGPGLLNASTAAGGSNILPQGIITGTVAGTAITGATVGTYPLTPASGSFTGVTANLVVTSATAATIVVTSPGRTTSASPTATVWTNPAGATIPAGTTLTGNIASQIANGNGQTYLTTDSTGNYLLYWQNTGTGAPSPIAGATGAQVSLPLSGALVTLINFIITNAGGSGSGLQFLDKRGLISALLNSTGLSVAGNVNAGQVNAPIVNAPIVNINDVTFGYGPDGFRVLDKRGFKMAELNAAGVLSAPSVVGGSGGGGTTLTSSVPVRKRIVSNHGGWTLDATTQKSNGTTQLTGTDRFSWAANADCRAPEFVFVNGYIGAAGVLQPTGNAVQVALAVEAAHSYASMYPEIGGCSGQPISSGGKTGYYIGDGAIVQSKPFPIGTIKKNDTNYYRLHKKVSTGQCWPYSKVSADYTWGGVSTTDAVMGSTITDGSDQSNTFAVIGLAPFTTPASSVSAWQAIAIVAEQVTPAPVVLVCGDSIGHGYGGTSLGRSYITRGLDNDNVAWWNGSMPGNDAYNLAMQDEIVAYLAAYVDHIIPHVGTNDIYAGTPVSPNLTAFQTNILLLAKHWARPGCKVWFCTILPRNQSSDNWATYANQTPYNSTPVTGGALTAETLRVTCNNWLMDATTTGATAFLKANMPYGSAQFGGIIDARALVEKNINGTAVTLDSNGQQTLGTGGYWPVNGAASYATADGIHPSDPMQIVMQAAVPGAAAFALT